ncbi:uncharacterized protein EDB93DRAFT_1336187 [Suillus bovinus]|uniref:uncharacterized protein n=1 Tax=Suillus bovinus TaxID=48563 RepID=UPI001B862162|nr:uncharacterized protein EDB93DRAFT_1336187 [Suillus bovinus]KAG2153645.1 hypothetical protein EDB93DRAFT_1336187 [Suillus bovinus]
MPATRSPSQHRSRLHASPTRNLPNRSKPKSNPATIPEHEIIVLSSDNENARPSKIGSSSRLKRKKPFPSREVLEISSSSDEGPMLPKTPGNDGPSWQREHSKVKKVNVHLERQVADQRMQLDNMRKRLEEQNQELAAQSREIDARHQEIQLQQEKLAALQAKGTSESSIDATKLGDMLSCDICAHLMYSPYLLFDCGHSYCEGCLKGWFDEILTKHIRAHPAYNVNRRAMPRNLPQVLRTIGPYVSYPVQMQLQAMYDASQQQPEYTCPGCRKEVTGKPVVNFAVKDMVSIVGNVLGQPDTRRESSDIARRQHAGPFDGFFPR